MLLTTNQVSDLVASSHSWISFRPMSLRTNMEPASNKDHLNLLLYPVNKKEISISFGGFNSYTISFEVDELHSKTNMQRHVLAITLSLEHTYYVPPQITPKSHVRVFWGDMFPSFIWGQFFQD